MKVSYVDPDAEVGRPGAVALTPGPFGPSVMKSQIDNTPGALIACADRHLHL